MADILAVDDSRVILDVITAILESEGHKVTVAEDGYAALEIASSRSFDLVFSDINMPKMSGISLLGELKKLDTYQHTPVVMVTTENSDHHKDKAKSLGAAGWLEKPITPERLLKEVQRLGTD